MKCKDNRWIESLRSFKELRNLAICGVLGALAIVLNYAASIQIGSYIRIGFSGLPNNVVDYLLGPAAGAIFGGAMDVIKYLLKPTGAFFPGFTITAMVSGMIYGAVWYKRKVTLLRVFIAEFLVKLVANVLLNTLWLNMLYGKAFFAIVPARALTNLIMLPIDTFIVFFMLKFIEGMKGRLGFGD